MARLVIESGDEKDREFKIAGSMNIGRLRTNPIPIQDPMSSREHTRVEFDGKLHVVQDLGSRNGTYLNGRQLKSEERRTLAHGDKIQIGRTVLMFVEDPEDIERRKKEETAAPPEPVPAPHVPAVHAAAEIPGLPSSVHYLIWVAVFGASLMLSRAVFDMILEGVLTRSATAGRF